MVCTAGKGRSPFGSNATFWLVVAGSLAVLSVAVLMARGPKRHKASATSATHPPPECMLCDLAKSVSSHPPTGSQCRHRGPRSRQHLHNTRRCYGP